MEPLRLALTSAPQAPSVVTVGPPSTPEAAAVRDRLAEALAVAATRKTLPRRER